MDVWAGRSVTWVIFFSWRPGNSEGIRGLSRTAFFLSMEFFFFAFRLDKLEVTDGLPAVTWPPSGSFGVATRRELDALTVVFVVFSIAFEDELCLGGNVMSEVSASLKIAALAAAEYDRLGCCRKSEAFVSTNSSWPFPLEDTSTPVETNEGPLSASALGGRFCSCLVSSEFFRTSMIASSRWRSSCSRVSESSAQPSETSVWK